MTLLEALLLGAVQGLFMFIPVSSSSHLALVQQWLIDNGSALPAPSSPELILFDLIVHVGTLVSIAFVLRRSLKTLLGGIYLDIRSRFSVAEKTSGHYLRLLKLGLLSVATTGVVGGIVYQTGTEVFNAPLLIAGNLVITGAILWWTDTIGPRSRDLGQLSPVVAIVIGAAQGIALLPGLSRSGLTIAAALFMGLKRRWAAEFSFFVAIPTILAASVVQLILVLSSGDAVVVAPAAFAVGFITAAIIGTGSLMAVLWLLYRARFRIFSYYVWALALLVASGRLVTL